MMTFVFSIWLKIAQKSLEREIIYNKIVLLFHILLVLTSISTLTIKPHTEFKKELPKGLSSVIWNILVAALGALFLFSVVGPSNFTNTVLRNLGIGGYKNVTIVLSEQGMDILASLGIKCSSTTEQNLCVLTNVRVLWGRGDEYLFNYINAFDHPIGEEGDKSSKKKEYNFTLSIENVLSILNEVG